MLSLMTVVLPQHSGNNGSSKAVPTVTVGSSSVSTGSNNITAGVGPSDSEMTRETCECSCRADMTKNNLAPRCPYLKGYMVEQTRHMHSSEMNVMPTVHHSQQPQQHPVTLREMESLREAACYWKEKYERLYESQKRLQKVNEGLEEKLLKIAEKFEGEKTDLTKDVSDLTARLVEARLTIVELEEENEQYRNDCNIAVRLLQCKPSNFVAHKFNSLPADFQKKVKRHLAQQNRRSFSSVNSRASLSSTPSSSTSLLDQCHPDVRTIKVSVPMHPSAAMVYSVNPVDNRNNQLINSGAFSSGTTSSPSSSEESTPDHVSAAIIAKVLEERSRERQSTAMAKRQNHFDSYQKGQVLMHASTQTTQPNICSWCSARIVDRGSSLSPASDAANFSISKHHQQQGVTVTTETAI